MRHDELLTASGRDEVLAERTSASGLSSEAGLARFCRFGPAMAFSATKRVRRSGTVEGVDEAEGERP